MTLEYELVLHIGGDARDGAVIFEWQRILWILTTGSRMSSISMRRTKSSICMMRLRSNMGHLLMITQSRFLDS